MDRFKSLPPALRWTAIALCVVVLLLLALWFSRARLAVEFTRAYFRSHGIASSVEIGALGLSGVSGRFALGPSDAPDISAEKIELRFDPLSFLPRVVEVQLVNPVLRARLDANGKVSLGSLQEWIDSLSQQKGRSRFVSDELAVALTGLRALLVTPGGPVEIDGDVKLVKNLPVSAALRAKPGTVAWRDVRATMRDARLTYDSSNGALALHFAGSLQNAALNAQDVEAHLTASKLHWENRDERLHVTAPTLHLSFAAASLVQGVTLDAPALDVTARNMALVLGAGMDIRADLAITAGAGLPASLVQGLRASDPALAAALAANLSRLEALVQVHVEKQGERLGLFAAPSRIKGARGGVLTLSALALQGPMSNLQGRIDLALAGGGLPTAKFTSRNIAIRDGVASADAMLSARFGYAMLRGAELSASTNLSWNKGMLSVQPVTCARFGLQAFHPGASDMAREVRANICPVRGAPLLTLTGMDWVLRAQARGASAYLPLANAGLSDAVADISFSGHGGDFKGTANVAAGRVSDRATSLRFNPLLGSGTAALQGGVWRGRFAIADEKNRKLADTSFSHGMATGTGTAHIDAASLSFAPDKLQPADISPLLVAFRRAEGAAKFSGDIDWTRAAITSRGTLGIEKLDFLTPLGKAHAVKTSLHFISLLPPITADDQGVTIARVDWTLPFSGVDVRFGFSPTTIKVDAVSTGWAEGSATLGAFTVNLADPKRISGAAELKSIALSSLITASNLGSRAKLEGKISGHVPFTSGPEGFRIVNGRVASDGPGRLSIDRTLWTKGEPAANAVQDFAYQALENLAFESMTAELNSIANGRLQILFKIKGRSDPPKPQTADIPITDIINGSALQKSVPLPSGTPIDLTLETSLNFDELLKSYAEAWSKSLSLDGQ